MHPETDVRVDPTGATLVAAIRKCRLVNETGKDLKKVITYLQTHLDDDMKIPALTDEQVTQSMTNLSIQRKKVKKGEVKEESNIKERAEKSTRETCQVSK